MRQLLLIASLVALFMYAGFVSLQGMSVPTAEPLPRPSASARHLVALERALEATGAPLGEALITGWVQTDQKNVKDGVMAALRRPSHWPKAEAARVERSVRNGKQFLTVNWRLQGDAAHHWDEALRLVQETLAGLGAEPVTAVQVSGRVPAGDPSALVKRALDTVGATNRQPWSDPHSASAAGRSPYLPASPLGVNVQVAARHDAATGHVTVWVAWPALNQEY